MEKHQLTIGRSHACVRIGSGIVRLDRVAPQIRDRGIWSLSHKTWQKKKVEYLQKGFFISVKKNVPFPFPYLDRSSKLPRKHARVGYMLWTRTKYKTEAGSIGSCSILIKNIFKLKMFGLTVAGFQLQSERFLLSFHLQDKNICSQPQKPQMHILAKWPFSFSWKRPQVPASQVFKYIVRQQID